MHSGKESGSFQVGYCLVSCRIGVHFELVSAFTTMPEKVKDYFASTLRKIYENKWKRLSFAPVVLFWNLTERLPGILSPKKLPINYKMFLQICISLFYLLNNGLMLFEVRVNLGSNSAHPFYIIVTWIMSCLVVCQ